MVVYAFLWSLVIFIYLLSLLVQDYLFFAIFVSQIFQNLFQVTIQFYSWIYHANISNYYQKDNNQNHANPYIN